MAHYKSAVELRLMRAVKQALDPHNLLNPGRLLP
jgi:FAD/FMN-containing dehydrogenase